MKAAYSFKRGREFPNCQALGGEKLLVMYNNDYGELTEIGDSGIFCAYRR
jgi:hypothetical protein